MFSVNLAGMDIYVTSYPGSSPCRKWGEPGYEAIFTSKLDTWFEYKQNFIILLQHFSPEEPSSVYKLVVHILGHHWCDITYQAFFLHNNVWKWDASLLLSSPVLMQSGWGWWTPCQACCAPTWAPLTPPPHTSPCTPSNRKEPSLVHSSG